MSLKLKEYFRLPKTQKNRLKEGGRRIKKNNVNVNPFFSIITVVLNNEKFIEQTIKSVLNQKYKNFEYIIIDGGSTDGTIEIIKKYEKKIDYWVSGKDKGLYDAFNKGMSVAKGEFIGIINSDDLYTKNSLSIISKYVLSNKKIDFIFGSVKKHWGILHGYRPEKIFYSWGFYSSHSTGFFLRRKAACKVGLYNIKYKYHADYDYFYRLIVQCKLKGTATKKKEIVGIFRRGGFSSTISFRKLFKEEMLIRWNHKQNLFLLFIIFIHKFFKHFNKIIKS
tara:strand:+ start:135 stop:971 length:837 start_codon:yes stop_codon:yes gene_type:complete